MPIIEVIDLEKHFGDVRAVDGISFAVEEGTVFGFLGPNGAGKTTTIRVLVTLSRQTGGVARVAGYDVTEDPQAVRRTIGYAAQATGIDGDLTGRENLVLQGRLHGMPVSEAKREADRLVEVVDLGDAADRRAGTYSGGMARRLDLAQALIHRPSVLFLDEPTTGLDPQNRNAVWAYLRSLNEQGITILLTTQYLEEADELADDLAIIDHGKIIVTGSPGELKRSIGGDSITLTVRSDATDADVEKVATAARAIADGGRVEVHGKEVVVYLEHGAERLADVVRAADATGVAIARVELAEPSLDQVFLRYTGEHLRVEEVKPPSRMSRMRGRRRR